MSDTIINIVEENISFTIVEDNINIVVNESEQINVQVDDEIINVQVAELPVPMDLYQKKIYISATPPAFPDVNDLWIDIS